MMNRAVLRFLKIAVFFLLLSDSGSLYACDIAVSMDTAPAGTLVFLAGYYGDRVLVVDSTRFDTFGHAVFSGNSLPQGIYTLFVPGLLRYEFLLAEEQNIRINSRQQQITVSGSTQSEAFAALISADLDKTQANAQRKWLIKQFAGSFLASYLVAMQPVEPPDDLLSDESVPMLNRYRYMRRHFFDHFDLSDVRLLHTPLYAETVKYYFSHFLTQQTDTLIAAAYSLLQKASGNCETFFFVMDFLVDYSLRNDLENMERLHRFLQPNRCMLSEKAVLLLPEKWRKMGFILPNEKIQGMQGFDQFNQENTRFHIFYFWTDHCPRCLSDAASWQKLVNKHRAKSCTGIAINVQTPRPADITLRGVDLCVHASGFSAYEHTFLTNAYAKIVLTASDGKILGIFGSLQTLDTFLTQMDKISAIR
ncbi:MAG: DUF5106 domain-containing protein [Bacteroidales bacterium]|jgi:thiol-disulfide isomerase/thioredoxin|nr:DUF5106 domain-containing protein [Bacteroidales bacterium]